MKRLEGKIAIITGAAVALVKVSQHRMCSCIPGK